MKQLRILVFPPLKKKSVHPGVTPSVKSVTPKKKFFGTHNDIWRLHDVHTKWDKQPEPGPLASEHQPRSSHKG